MEKDDKNNKKNTSVNEDKTKETDSINDLKNSNIERSSPPSNNKNINRRKNSSCLNADYIPGLKEKKSKSNITKKTYNNYNYYNNYNNYNNYNYYNNNMPEEKRQITTIKLSRNKNINNLNELFNMISEKREKKDGKNNEKSDKEKDIDNNNEKLNYYYKLNSKSNKKTEEMKPIFLNDEKTNNAFNLEKDLYKSLKKDSGDNIDSNNLSKIEIDCSNSLFNFDGFFCKNDPMNTSKINFKDESMSNEDIKEGEEIRNYFNKSLIDKIENPFWGEDKNDQFESMYNKDKSRFFNFDFFGNDNNDGKF